MNHQVVADALFALTALGDAFEGGGVEIGRAAGVVHLEEGEVVAFGNHDELMKSNEIYREIYTTQMKGSDE